MAGVSKRLHSSVLKENMFLRHPIASHAYQLDLSAQLVSGLVEYVLFILLWLRAGLSNQTQQGCHDSRTRTTTASGRQWVSVRVCVVGWVDNSIGYVLAVEG